MKSKIIAIIALAAVGMVGCQPAMAAVWGNVYGDYVLNEGIAGNPNEEISKTDTVIGAEGGIVTDKVDAYAFLEHNTSLDTLFSKGSVHVKVYKDITIYGQASGFADADFTETRVLGGIGYAGLHGDNWQVKPFIGINSISNDFGDDTVPMVGWSGTMQVAPKVLLSSWHETEINHGVTMNGAVGAFYETDALVENSYVGVQYHYGYDALGIDGYGDMVLFRIGMHL